MNWKDGMNAGALEVNTSMEQPAGGRSPSDRSGLSRRAFMRAHLFMEARLGEPLTPGDIAAAACLSRSHFARAFRATTGCSVMAYLYRMRVERAKTLLAEGGMNISDLSAELGFAHHSHFTRVFRRFVGVNPRAFAHRYVEAPAEFIK
jgi:AraC family transcriptional regulator